MSIIEQKLENNRQILTRLRKSLQFSNEFKICINQIKIMFFEFDAIMKNAYKNDFHVEKNNFKDDLYEKNNFSSDFHEEINFSNDFLNFLDCELDVIVDKWKTLILNNATISRSIKKMFARKHIHEHDIAYDD